MSSPCGYCYGTGRRKLRFQRLNPQHCHAESCLPCTKLATIQIGINAARVAPNTLLEERNTIANEFNEAHDPLSQSHLPVEIAKEVFKFCLPLQPSLHVFDEKVSYGKHESQEFDDQIKMLLTLGRVNRRWRLITNTTSDLWKVLPLNFTTQGRYDPDVLATWLDRSKQQSLFLWIHVVWFQRPPGHDDKRCLDSLHPHYDRVKLLALDACNPDFPSYLSRNEASKLPNLQKLSIIQRSYFGVFTSSLLYIDVAPQELRLFGGVRNVRINRWDELQQLEVADVSIVSFLQLLQNAHNLQSCKVNKVSPEGSRIGSLPIHRFEHQSMKILDISKVCPEFWIINSFPNLRELTVDLGGRWSDLELIGDFVPSCCQLERLCISDKLEDRYVSPSEAPGLLRVLEKTSDSLRTLRLTNIAINNQFFSANFLPLLEDVHIEYGYRTLPYTGFIERFLKQRCAAEFNGHLTRFHIDPSPRERWQRDMYRHNPANKNEWDSKYGSLKDTACGIDLVVRNEYGRDLACRGVELGTLRVVL